MICDNCGANINKDEEYCPECGMELLTHKKKNYHNKSKNSKSSRKENSGEEEFLNYNNSQSIEKPIKEKYIGYLEPESPNYSQYYDDTYYEDDNPHYETDAEHYNEKKGSKIGTIIVLLFIALVFGFIVGLLMFSSNSQYIPQIPGFNT
ncbi:MAG: zinc-ribbon domain-containing protein [Methanobacterium sp.]